MDMPRESEADINMPTSSPDHKKAVLSSQKELVAKTMHRQSLFEGTGRKSFDLAKATVATVLARLQTARLQATALGFQLS